jgi:hypothetical protein
LTLAAPVLKKRGRESPGLPGRRAFTMEELNLSDSDSAWNAILLLIDIRPTYEERSEWRSTLLDISRLPITYERG